jgi:RNA-splicing ligase RtcB
VPELLRGTRRGIGFALGFSAVLAVANTLRRGGRQTMKAAMKGMIQAREAGAEAAEQMQDIYAEAANEYADERVRAYSGIAVVVPLAQQLLELAA